MKAFIYLVLIIAFLIFYQSEPVIAGVLFVVFIVIFVYFRMRKSGGKGSSRFFSKGFEKMSANNDNLMFFFIMQQLFREEKEPNSITTSELTNNARQEYVEGVKEKILSLLDKKP